MGPLTSNIPILSEEGSVVVRLAFVLIAIGLGRIQTQRFMLLPYLTMYPRCIWGKKNKKVE